MRIAIDASQIVYETGVSTYTRNLISGLLSVDRDNRYVIFGGSLRKFKDLQAKLELICANIDNCEIKTFPYPPLLSDIVWNKLDLFPIDTLIGESDVFHSSDWSQPKSRAFSVTTVHDLIPILYPKISHPKLVSVHKRRLERVKRYTDRIIVPSQSTKEDLVKIGVKSSIIRVIPEAPDIAYKPASKEQILNMKRRYRISGKYILSIGVTPRKNTHRIIEAFEKIKAEYDLKLVIVGHHYSKTEDRRGVIYLGHVPAKDLPVLYTGSKALVYPSLYEGFGLPILEAYATKTPVVTSNLGSMKETAGDAAVLVDPYDVDSIKNGIIRALERNKELAAKGKKELLKYSWTKTAKMTLEVYNESGKV